MRRRRQRISTTDRRRCRRKPHPRMWPNGLEESQQSSFLLTTGTSLAPSSDPHSAEGAPRRAAPARRPAPTLRAPRWPRIARLSALEQRCLCANERRARPAFVTMVRRLLIQAYIRQRGRAGSRSARCCVRASPIRFSQGETIGIKRGGLQRCLERDGIPDHHDIGCRPRRRRGTRPNQWRYQMAELPPPPEGIVLTHFIVSDDVERSRRFYTEVLGGRVVFSGEEARPMSHCPTAGSSSTGAVGRRTTSRRSPWRRRAIPAGSAASSISGSRTSRPCTPNGAPGVRIS